MRNEWVVIVMFLRCPMDKGHAFLQRVQFFPLCLQKQLSQSTDHLLPCSHPVTCAALVHSAGPCLTLCQADLDNYWQRSFLLVELLKQAHHVLRWVAVNVFLELTFCFSCLARSWKDWDPSVSFNEYIFHSCCCLQLQTGYLEFTQRSEHGNLLAKSFLPPPVYMRELIFVSYVVYFTHRLLSVSSNTFCFFWGLIFFLSQTFITHFNNKKGGVFRV